MRIKPAEGVSSVSVPVTWGAMLIGILLLMVSGIVAPVHPAETQQEYTQINVVEKSTGRPVPMVKLIFHNEMIFYTDNQGIAAVRIPGLMGETVQVKLGNPSPGYDFKGFIFPIAGVTLTPGGSDTIAIRRENIDPFAVRKDDFTDTVTRGNVAQRLYRVTGMGLYRDSVLVGEDVPIEYPLSNQDVPGHGLSYQGVFKGQLHWFFDGHGQVGNPAANFHLSGAVSDLPDSGGLDSEKGVNLDYFTGAFQKPRPLLRTATSDQTILHNVMVTRDDQGDQVLFAYYQSLDDGSRMEHGILRWKDGSPEFQFVKTFPDAMKVNVCRNTTRVRAEGREWFYLTCPHPVVRVPVHPDQLKDPTWYETFTPLRQGSTLDDPMFDRDEDGDIVWGWKNNTSTVRNRDQPALVESTSMTREEGLFHLTDLETGRSIIGLGGTVNWNEHRQKWVMVTTQAFGRSKFGEVWYAEADSPLGPWVYARRIVTHRQKTRWAKEYSFGFPKLHPYFQKQDGETIFFSGQFTNLRTKSAPVPRYNQNQMMYRMNLEDPDLYLPSAVYEYRGDQDRIRYGTRKNTTRDIRSSPTVRYYALPPDRPDHRGVPVWSVEALDSDGNQVVRLTTDSSQVSGDEQPVFYALPSDTDTDNPIVEGLFEYKNKNTGKLLYSPTDRAPGGNDWVQNRGPIVKTWSSPRLNPPTDPYSQPVKKCLGASAHC